MEQVGVSDRLADQITERACLSGIGNRKADLGQPFVGCCWLSMFHGSTILRFSRHFVHHCIEEG